jgi:hypothetical protein
VEGALLKKGQCLETCISIYALKNLLRLVERI